jgi:hypothetical protein
MMPSFVVIGAEQTRTQDRFPSDKTFFIPRQRRLA